jgi:hypothetical protein
MLSTESKPKSLYGHRYSIRRRENSDSRALFELFKQPLCQQGMICDGFASPAHFQSWIGNAGFDILDIVATCETAVIGHAGIFSGRENRGHVGSLSLFAMMNSIAEELAAC